MERLDRGLIAIYIPNKGVYIGWRMLATDPQNIAFNVYRNGAHINQHPIVTSTNFVDSSGTIDALYSITTIVDGKESKPTPTIRPLEHDYLSIPLRSPQGYRPNDASVGDLDGDGQYEIVLKLQARPRDNSQPGLTGQTKLEAYKLNGTFLWRIDLGKNIREGQHYSPFIVYDLDGDNQAEVICRTADGTKDGTGHIVGDPNADYCDDRGFIYTGPEYLTVFDGRTGRALITTDYLPPRGNASDWGDGYGNRSDRFLACVAYLDGKRPSLIMCRGYYTRTVLVAWNYRDGRLSHLWTFDTNNKENHLYSGQGYHNLAVGDVDNDGKDEIIYGACAIDDNGKGLYTTMLGHGDAMHLTDIDPDRQGLEVFGIHEKPNHDFAVNLRDAATGKILWAMKSTDAMRALTADIDPRYRGYECWAIAYGLKGLYSCKGEKISDSQPSSCNMAVWWDGDLLRELLDGTTISKWDYLNERTVTLFSATDCRSNNDTKATPCLCADILGDWREEVIFGTKDNRELRIYTTIIPTNYRFCTLMHDIMYRLAVAWQNVGYNQPTQTSFYLGSDNTIPNPH